MSLQDQFSGSPLLTPGQPPTSFVQRLIELTVTLAENTQTNQPLNLQSNSPAGPPTPPGSPAVGSFSQGGNTVTLSGYRTSVRIQNSGTPTGSTAEVSIYGLPLTLINQLSTLGMAFNLIPKNTLVISAGDPVSGLAVVFWGTIIQAYPDFSAMPDVAFHFECNSYTGGAVTNVPPSSYTGPTDVATIMSSLASQMGYQFENSGVNVKLPAPYLPGSAGSQWQKIRDDAGINADIIPGSPNPTLAIWPMNGSRNVAGAIPVISPPDPETGELQGANASVMVGYPSFTPQGVIVKTVFNRGINFGGKFQVAGSQLTPANNTWVVHKLDHALDSLMPKGEWLSTVYGYGLNVPFPVITPQG